jgi:WD40 repeat protein
MRDQQIFSQDGRMLLLLWGASGHLYDLETAKYTPAKLPERGTFGSAVLSPDGRTVALLTNGAAALWDMPTGKQQFVLANGDQADSKGRGVVFAGDGKTLIYVDDQGVRRWNVATGKPIGQPLLCWQPKEGMCDPTVHRVVHKVVLPSPDHPAPCLREPTATA